MTTNHTAGPLAVNPLQLNQICAADASCEVAMVTVMHPAAVTVENARRLVACWNALHGIPTEALELAPNVEDVWNDLIAERDKLHAALETARNGLAWYQDTYPGAASGCDDEAMAEIDAALASRDPTT